MKLIKAFIHHVRGPAVVEALADAGFQNITLQDVRGMLKPVTENERYLTTESSALVISELRLSLVVGDADVDAVTGIICTAARIGSNPSGYVYVSPVDQVLTIGPDQ